MHIESKVHAYEELNLVGQEQNVSVCPIYKSHVSVVVILYSLNYLDIYTDTKIL